MSHRIWAMLLLGGVCCLSCRLPCLAEEPLKLDDQSGTTLYVIHEGAHVHSGPSLEHYPTSRMLRGQSLEGFQRSKDWIGVRPPEGSFSWISATDAYLLPGGRVIEITSTSAVSWIGTDLGSAKQYGWQVQLSPGEQLAVVGERTMRREDGKEVLWYKIAPPAGEFRWIQADHVSQTPPNPQPRKTDTRSPSRRDTAATNSPQGTGEVKQAAHIAANGSGSVTSAQYEGPQYEDVVADEVFSQSSDAHYAEGEFTESPYYEDDYAYDDGFYELGPGEQLVAGPGIAGPGIVGAMDSYSPRKKDHFDGWHAFELNDDGLRPTWFEKILGRLPATTHDPLQQDPFDLSMSGGVARKRQASVAQYHSEHPSPTEAVGEQPSPRGYTPWRDPRVLRERRLRHDDFSASSHSAPSRSRAFSGLGGYADGSSEESPISAPRTPFALVSSTTNDFGNPQPQGSRGVNWYGASPGGSGSMSGVSSSDLQHLQMSLAEVVAQPMSQWDLQSIHDQVRRLIEQGNDPIQRGRARLLLERIEEFAAVAQSSGIAALSPQRSTAAVVTASATPPATAASPAAWEQAMYGTAGQEEYDATGWIIPVYAAREGQPSHALTDEAGRILAYVSGLPGMKLDRYLNQAVGIIGLRGYLPQLQAGHIQAQRIVRLP